MKGKAVYVADRLVTVMAWPEGNEPLIDLGVMLKRMYGDLCEVKSVEVEVIEDVPTCIALNDPGLNRPVDEFDA